MGIVTSQRQLFCCVRIWRQKSITMVEEKGKMLSMGKLNRVIPTEVWYNMKDTHQNLAKTINYSNRGNVSGNSFKHVPEKLSNYSLQIVPRNLNGNAFKLALRNLSVNSFERVPRKSNSQSSQTCTAEFEDE